MWTPAERIKHSLPIARSPSIEEASRAMLFSPLRLRSGLELADRTWVPAMVPWRATDNGFVTREVLDWYARFAEGQPGAIVVEATGIRDAVALGTPQAPKSGPLLRIGHDRFLDGLKSLVEVVKRKSGGRTKLFVQCIDFLAIKRRPEKHKFFIRFFGLTEKHRRSMAHVLGDDRWMEEAEGASRERLASLDDAMLERILEPRELESLRMGHRERVDDVHLPHVRDLPKVLPDLFADAAARAKTAGFDGVELHFAHAYTMASFLSRTNARTDGYGVSLENRARLPLEVFAAVRARVGASFTVGCRFLCDEVIDGGSDADDACFFGVSFARAGMDFLSLSTGGKFDDAKQPKVGEAAYPYTGRSGWECMPTTIADARGPFARNVPKQARVRAAVRAAGFDTPVVVAGGICTFEQAEGILARGEGDVIGAARQSLADPDWFLKLRMGRGVEIRRCTYTNYCEALDQRHRSVTCKLWDRVDLDEPGAPIVEDEGRAKRRLVAPPWRK
jgi:2,4-dienoyl-CoA reductase-like NADH-dependent reductase (Old Yellow Enzyme family)